MTTRQRSVPNADALDVAVDDYIRAGYAVETHTDQRAVVRDRDHGSLLGHLFVFVLFGWWTLFGANVCYALWRRYVSTDRVEVVVK